MYLDKIKTKFGKFLSQGNDDRKERNGLKQKISANQIMLPNLHFSK